LEEAVTSMEDATNAGGAAAAEESDEQVKKLRHFLRTVTSQLAEPSTATTQSSALSELSSEFISSLAEMNGTQLATLFSRVSKNQ
jgi:hypothetical protein